VKSKKAKDYKQMITDSLYHPPSISITVGDDKSLVLNHLFEGKPLYRDYIEGTLLGLEFLWGTKVSLFTNEAERVKGESGQSSTPTEGPQGKISWKKVRYTMKDRKMSRAVIE
jgi:stage V sporulation protein R